MLPTKSLLCYNTQGHGIDVTGGTVVGHQLYIETHGASASSGISTDTGGGNISIYDSQVVTYGTGSLVVRIFLTPTSRLHCKSIFQGDE